MPVISASALPLLPPPPALDARAALFLDVDGTLLDFALHANPVIDATLLADLRRLSGPLEDAIALISGRPLETLDRLFGWHGRAVAGAHGADVRMPDGQARRAGNLAAFAAVRRRAAELVAEAEDVLLDDKTVGLGLFYHHHATAAERIADELANLAGPDYVLFRGKQGVELRPAHADKGTALAMLMAAPPFHGRVPWMIGDDEPDEAAFAAANALGGVSIRVGPAQPTQARYSLPDPAAVRAFLHRS